MFLRPAVWLDVDTASGICTIHGNQNCCIAGSREETPVKGVGRLRDEGGWMVFRARDEATEYCKRNFPGYNVTVCCR
ncbi:MAG: hypothetical protein ACM3QZ_11800 [Solirubrobacterales bacterium]